MTESDKIKKPKERLTSMTELAQQNIRILIWGPPKGEIARLRSELLTLLKTQGFEAYASEDVYEIGSNILESEIQQAMIADLIFVISPSRGILSEITSLTDRPSLMRKLVFVVPEEGRHFLEPRDIKGSLVRYYSQNELQTGTILKECLNLAMQFLEARIFQGQMKSPEWLQLQNLSFAQTVMHILSSLGYGIIPTTGSGDIGVDFLVYAPTHLSPEPTKAIVECKNYRRAPSKTDISKLASQLIQFGAKYGLLAVSSVVDQKTREFAKGLQITILDSSDLARINNELLAREEVNR